MSRIPTLTHSVVMSAETLKSGVVRPSTAGTNAPISQASYQLADVPLSVLTHHSAWVPSGQWQGIFDCALWLRTPKGLSQPVQLAVCYVDNQGEKVVMIDRCAAGSYRTVLLNGSVRIAVNGQVRKLGLYLVGVGDPAEAIVEEWHVVPQQRRT